MFTTLLLLVFISTIHTQDDDYFQNYDEYNLEEQILKSELEMAGLELRDDCENIANTYRGSLVTNTYGEKLKVGEAHAQLAKVLSQRLKKFESDVSPELERNWTLFMKPGDALLENDDYRTLVSYSVGVEEYIHTEKIHCHNETDNCIIIKKGYDKLYATSRNGTVLKKAWAAWQALLSSQKKEFQKILTLVDKAATKNEKDGAKTYWEMLVELEDAYTLADNLWENLKPLYSKLHDFVKKQLFYFYKIENSEIPVYLLGSNFGRDWSNIADIVLPYPHIYTQADKYIQKQSIKDIYKMAEEMTEMLSLGRLGPEFWTNSLFNMTFCENNIVSDCVKEYSGVFTCERTSWVSYLDAFENAIDISLKNMNYVALPQMSLRLSVIDEAMKNVGSFLAIKNMRYRGVWDKNLSDDDNGSMAELLLLALRVLPKLPYYITADKWRLELLDAGFDNIEERWWGLRKEYQGVTGVTNREADFLGDGYITSNKPYLSKFLGVVLAFQILSYYENNWQDPNENFAKNIADDENFLNMLYGRSSNDWPTLLSNHYAIYELSTDAILNFFSPLNDYLDNLPVGQVTQTSTTPQPTTTQYKPKNESNPKPKSLIEVPKDDKNTSYDVTEGPHFPPVHEHVEENLEGPNHLMEDISMYIGLILLVGVAGLIVFVVVSKKMKKRSNNRRFET